MGWEQRSRKFLPPGTICYLCGQPIDVGERWNRDHIPPARLFGKSVKNKYSLALDWHYTHETCNSSYKDDEEYFTVSFVGHVHSETARSVFDDVSRGAAKGHDTQLIRSVLARFGGVRLPDGTTTFAYDGARVGRYIWKLVRGLYFEHVGKLLADDHRRAAFLIPPSEAPLAEERYPWWTLIRDTEPLGRYGAVFDFKWVGLLYPNGGRVHGVGMLLWDGLLLLALFHDPSCPCEECPAAPTKRPRNLPVIDADG